MGSSTIYVDLEGIKPSLLKRQKRRAKKNQKELAECYGASQAWLSTARATRSRLKNYERSLGYEFVPKKLSIKFVHVKLSGDYKYFENTAKPLRRFLKSKVGQNWDRVYSELNKKIDKRTRTGEYLFEQLFRYVEADTVCIEGKVYRSNGEKLFSDRWYRGGAQLYVHPVSRILHRFRRKYYR